MERIISKERRLGFLILVVLLLLIPSVWSYFIYVSNRRVYLTDRNFRLLGLTSQQIQARLEYLNTAWDQMNRELQESFPRDNAKKEAFEEFAAGKINLISGLEKGSVTFEYDSQPLKNDFEVERKRDTVTAYFRFQHFTQRDSTTTCPARSCPIQITARSQLSSLLTPLLNRPEFDDVLVARQQQGLPDDYEVIFQRESSGIQILTLSLPVKREQPGAENTKSQSNRVDKINLGDVRYSVFLQPMQLSFATSNGTTTTLSWLVCGLIRADRFLSESFSIPTPILLVFIFLLVAAPLAWPFLNLWFMQRRERLSTSDVVFLMFSILFGSALFTLLLLDAYAYWQLAAKMDQRLKRLADNIHNNLHDELDSIHQQLIQLRPNMTDAADRTKVDREQRSIPLQTSVLKNSDHYSLYPYFDLIFLTDRLGDQLGKWTVQAQTTPVINVHDRSYVSSILYCWPWIRALHGTSGKNGQNVHFFVEPIYSWNTGENLTVYAIPWQDRPDSSPTCTLASPNYREAAVVALATRPVSLTQPVLPSGFGYTIIKADGWVLFHVDDTHNLRENLFEETARNKRLRSAVFGHTIEWIDAQYEGTPHRLYIRPIDGLPWFLVVYQDKAILRTAHLEILSVAVILAVFYFFILIVMLLLYLWTSGDRLRWLWPTPMQTRTYWCFGVFNLGLSLALGLGVGFVTARPLFLAITMLCVPVLELVFICAVLRRRLTLSVDLSGRAAAVWKRESRWFRFGYVFAVASLFLPLSVFPALAFFQVAHDEEMALVVKHGQLQLVRALEERERRIKDQYLFVEVDKKELFLKNRLQVENAPDVYMSFFFDTHIFNATPRQTLQRREDAGFAKLLSYIRPVYTDASLELRGVLGSGSADHVSRTPAPLSWAWQSPEAEEGTAVLHKRLQFRKERLEDSNLHIVSTLPVLERLPGVRGWIGLSVVVVLSFALLYCLVRVVAQRVFLQDVLEPPGSRNLQALQGRIVSGNLLALGPPFSGKSAWLQQRVQHDDWYVIDCRKRDETLNEEDAALERPKVIALDHFEYQLGVPAQDHAKLLLLEKLLSMYQKSVIIVSTRDPVAFYCGDRDRGTWTEIFSTFSPVYIGDEGERQAFAHSMLERAVSSTKHQRTLLRLVKDECYPTAYLRKVGQQLVLDPRMTGFTPRELREAIWDQTRTYYEVVWSTCSPGEQFLLICLAQDRFINTRNPDIDRLLRTRLIVRAPELRLMNTSFERFVRTATPPPQAVAWQAERHSGWNALKGPVLVVLAGVALFLYVTQPDLFNATTAFASAVMAGGMPALLKLFTTFVQGDKAED